MRKVLFAVGIVVLCFTVLCGLVACNNGGEEKSTLTIHFETGFSDVEVEDLIIMASVPAVMPDDPKKLGYEFLGWYYDEGHATPFVIGEGPLYLSTDLTVYASWKKLGGSAPELPAESAKGLYYELWDKTYAVAGYDGEATEIVVPDTYKGVAVTAIEASAFANSNLTKITLGKNISVIEEKAFRGLSELTAIVVSADNTHFVSEWGVLYTYGKTALVAAPAKGTLSTLALPSTIRGLSDYALDGCRFELTFVQNGSYEEIGAYDLAGFAGRVILNGGIKMLRRHAFEDATCEIVFASDSAVTTLPMQVFSGYQGAKLTIPGTVKNVEPYAFADCTAEVDLSKLGLTKITQHLFGEYHGKKLEIPATVTSIEKYAFDGATCEITFAFGSAYVEAVDYSFGNFGVATRGADGKMTIEGKVTFPTTVTKISTNAFVGAYAGIAFEDGRSNKSTVDTLSGYLGKTDR